MMKKISINTIILFICLYSFGQINTKEKPFSFTNEIKALRIEENETPNIEIPKINFEKLNEEDLQDKPLGPYRFGKVMEVSYNWHNSGKWIELENGDRIWFLTIHCPMAKSINLSYDKFWLPEGGRLYLYDKEKIKIIGGLTRKNNSGTKEKPSRYATGLLFSDEITLEYFEPKDVRDEGIISISKIVCGFRNINTLFSTSEEEVEMCVININCSPEGDDWQDEKTSVALVISDAGVFSGALINNIREDGTPYFLTANHNINNVYGNTYDAISNPDASDLIFWWKYEYPTCNGSNYSYVETIGATIVANDETTDFALLRLHETPYDLSPQIQAFYSGWDRQIPISGSVCIHHPQFNPKKNCYR